MVVLEGRIDVLGDGSGKAELSVPATGVEIASRDNEGGAALGVCQITERGAKIHVSLKLSARNRRTCISKQYGNYKMVEMADMLTVHCRTGIDGPCICIGIGLGDCTRVQCQ